MVDVRRRARIAGALYVLMSVPGAFYLQVIPLLLVVRGNAAATAERMVSSEPLFRLGLAAELVSSLVFTLTPLALFELFHRVDRRKATLMVILVYVSLPVSFTIVIFETAAFAVLTGPDYLTVFSEPQRQALALLLVGLHGRGLDVASIFWGLWLIPLGLLVYESRFAPRAIGALLVFAGLGYVAAGFASIVAPSVAGVAATVMVVGAGLGEISFIGWCLGTRTKATLPA